MRLQSYQQFSKHIFRQISQRISQQILQQPFFEFCQKIFTQFFTPERLSRLKRLTRTGSKYGLILLSALLCFYLSLSLVVSFLDLNPYKDKISQWVFEKTGETLVIEGPIQFSTFPSVLLTAEKVSLKSKPGSNNLNIHAGNLKIYPHLFYLLFQEVFCGVEIEDLRFDHYRVDHFKTKYQWKNGISELFVSKILMNKNKIEDLLEIDYLKIDTQGDMPKYYLKHQANHFPLFFLLKLLESETPISGNTFMNVQLTSEGITGEQIKRHLNGQFELEIRDGKIYGFDVLASLKEAKSLIHSLTAKFTSNLSWVYHTIAHKKVKNTGISHYEKIIIKANIENGVINKHLDILHAHYHVKGAGYINLKHNTVDYRIEARYKKHGVIHEANAATELAPLKIHINGNLAKPHVNADLNSYLKFIAQQEVGKPQRGSGKKTIQSIKKAVLEQLPF